MKSFLDEAQGIIATDDIARDILKVIRDNRIVTPNSKDESNVMNQIMVLITRRDDKLTNYAYKMGRASS